MAAYAPAAVTVLAEIVLLTGLLLRSRRRRRERRRAEELRDALSAERRAGIEQFVR